MRWARRLACASLMLVASLGASLGAGAATAAAQAQAPKPEDAPPALVEESTPTAPVELDGVELFRVRGVSSFPAERRAQAIRDRIAAAAADPAISLDAIRITVAEGQLRISAGDRPIMAVLPADARVEQVSEESLALAHLAPCAPGGRVVSRGAIGRRVTERGDPLGARDVRAAARDSGVAGRRRLAEPPVDAPPASRASTRLASSRSS